MRFFLRIISFFVNLFEKRKKTKKYSGSIPKDNYPMF